PISGATETQRTSESGLLDNLDDAHHSPVLVTQDVAVVDVLAGEVDETRTHRDRAVGRQRSGVFPPRRLIRLAIDGDDLEFVDVNMERVPLVAIVVDRPFLERAELHRLV